MLDGFCEYLRRQGKSENTVKAYCQGMKEYMRWHEETFGKRMKARQCAGLHLLPAHGEGAEQPLGQRQTGQPTQFQPLPDRRRLYKGGGPGQAGLFESAAGLRQPQHGEPGGGGAVPAGDPGAQRRPGLCNAGLRISECLALRVEDISLPAREIKVRHGKGDKMRVVYFGDKVVNAVREYLRNRPKTGNPYLFPGRGDSHLTRSQVNRIFNEYSESITPHTLRHFFCSNALENGYTIADLANQAGHSNVHTTYQPHPGEDEGEGEPPLSDLSVLYIIR